MKKPTLSVVLAVKNEEKNIQKCLESVKWADEIIIIDNGSTDKTVKLAKKYTKKIYSCPKKLVTPELQNMGIKKATKDWILVLDADVVVPISTKVEILEKIQNLDYDGFYMHHPPYCFGKFLVSFNKDKFGWVLKLFKKTTNYVLDRHSTIKFKGKTGRITNPFYHYVYPDMATYVRKNNLYSSQDAGIIFKTGKGGLLKKEIKRIGLYALLIEPFLFSLHYYFIKKFYKEERHGLILSVLMGYHLFLERAKVWELKYKTKTSKHKKYNDFKNTFN